MLNMFLYFLHKQNCFVSVCDNEDYFDRTIEPRFYGADRYGPVYSSNPYLSRASIR